MTCISEAKEFFKKLSVADKKFHELHGAGHAFTMDDDLYDFRQVSDDWLTTRVQ